MYQIIRLFSDGARDLQKGPGARGALCLMTRELQLKVQILMIITPAVIGPAVDDSTRLIPRSSTPTLREDDRKA
ncbi:hypothetical protein CTA1_9083 [Colletotrichum tanaceti]|uniref:Uncharacterized protein n=1 Tax=Colletotrichum tanaceti TaxID=1306861 RepID=A0A4U6XN81_9PEZI|nr:hypothetical protein CTA1_9083 [Colletotrichum tanaceti]